MMGNVNLIQFNDNVMTIEKEGKMLRGWNKKDRTGLVEMFFTYDLIKRGILIDPLVYPVGIGGKLTEDGQEKLNEIAEKFNNEFDWLEIPAHWEYRRVTQ
ncbi:hypothetical protein [Paenibacillus elgii]|uniref:hypothetical protein n=1 Tax=Paenibacillus elgii TaxID=189691 RepID=UPI00203FCECE|nr:hypothetical protein [Paenibacillus elgii]MCM3273058.1 hypothetical protein [Paenibacillus elgii]